MQRAEHHEDLVDVVGFETRPLSQLVRSASDGERAAWRELITRFGDVIVAVGRQEGLSGLQIDQLQQTIWLRLVESLDRIEEPEQVGAWLSATTSAECQLVLKRDAS